MHIYEKVYEKTTDKMRTVEQEPSFGVAGDSLMDGVEFLTDGESFLTDGEGE